MELIELFLVALSLSMDAFAVSLCKGLSVGRPPPGQCLTCGAWFGGFEALMPLVGFGLGVRFPGGLCSVAHGVAFVLLGLIGANMVREALGGDEEHVDSSFGPRAMLPLAVATSIDALAVGVTFAFLRVEIAPAVALIGVTTLVLSALGVKVGSVFGDRFQSKAELAGGVILILMGTKILLEHTVFS